LQVSCSKADFKRGAARKERDECEFKLNRAIERETDVPATEMKETGKRIKTDDNRR
jgi:hypothetical protein